MEKLESHIAEFVGNYTRRHGYPPTVEEYKHVRYLPYHVCDVLCAEPV